MWKLNVNIQILVLLNIICSLSLVNSSKDLKMSIIIELDKENYQDFIEKSDTTLLFFYDKACPKYKKYDNVLNETLKRLIGESLSTNIIESLNAKEILEKVHFAKIDGYKNKEISSLYEIENFPSVKLIRPKFKINKEMTESIDINTLSPQHVINYLKKRILKNWIEINTPKQLKEINKENSINLVLCDLPNSNLTQVIDNLIVNYDDVFLSRVNISNSNQKLLNFLKCWDESPEIIIYKNFDEK